MIEKGRKLHKMFPKIHIIFIIMYYFVLPMEKISAGQPQIGVQKEF